MQTKKITNNNCLECGNSLDRNGQCTDCLWHDGGETSITMGMYDNEY